MARRVLNITKSNTDLLKPDLNIKDFYVAIAVASVLALGVFVGLIPQAKDIVRMNSESREMTATLTSLENKLAILETFPDSELNGMVSSIEASLPSDKPIFQVLGMIESVATQNGLTVDSFEFSPGSIATESGQTKAIVRSGGVQSLEMKATLVGTFENLLAFIKSIESSNPVGEVEGFSVSAVSTIEEEIKTTMVLNVFFQYPPTTISNVAAPIKALSEDQLAVIRKAQQVGGSNIQYFDPTASPPRENPFAY